MYSLYIPYAFPIYSLYIPIISLTPIPYGGCYVSLTPIPYGGLYVGVRDTLTGYVVPERVGDGTWMAWENYSAVVVAAVAHARVATKKNRMCFWEITKRDFPGMAWNGSRMVRNGSEW